MRCKIDRWLERQADWKILSLSTLIYLIVETAGYAVKIDLSLSFFHLLPIAITAWYVSRKASILMSTLCCVTWLYVDIISRNYHPSVLPFWNFGIRLSLFVFVSYLISAQRNAYNRESKFARVDSLTGISNRRAFEEVLRSEIARAHRHQIPFTLAYIDIDNFKAINDRLGHGEGDRLLKSVASQLQIVLRVSDTVGRLGGDEFALLLPHTPPAEARTVITRSHAHLNQTVGGVWAVGFSIGAVTFTDFSDCVEAIIAKTDKVMYDSKKGGKNLIGFCLDYDLR